MQTDKVSTSTMQDQQVNEKNIYEGKFVWDQAQKTWQIDWKYHAKYNIVVNKPVNNKENYNGTQFSDNLLMVRRVYANA